MAERGDWPAAPGLKLRAMAKDVLFVCLGNICRSPMAEAVMIDLVSRRQDAHAWLIDSAGTGSWHVGSEPHAGTLDVCSRRGVPIAHRARQVERSDFHRFDLILAMDRMNLADLRTLRPRGGTAAMELLGKYDPLGESEVPDPYHSHSREEFEQVYAQLERCCRALLETIPDGKPVDLAAELEDD
jgi:low molecular weight phosphotyrosine protein phosphatase